MTLIQTKQANINAISIDNALVQNNFSKEVSAFYNMSYERTKAAIKNDLLYNNYDPIKYKLNIETNTNLIRDIFTIFQCMPKLNDITQTKPDVPIFEQIEELKTDSAEIKKFIRKVNYDMIGYHCNHNSINEKCDKVYSNVVNIYKSDEYQDYQSFINHALMIAISIINKDKDGKPYDVYPRDPMLCKEPEDFSFGFIDKCRIKEVSNNILIINGMIANNNAQTNKSCSRCDAARRKYNYSLFQIDRMREELKEQQEIDQQYEETPDENKYDMKWFLQKNYPSIDRFLLKDVQTKYKATFKINLTYDELKKKIEETGMFTISNVHRTMYVNRK
ncbi:hypothetical protein M9Y10_037182 [Tritrichomonas musculus]|uniref:Uncharacterized protein n=1 Tax=Tritrichomonas musculus TaxID=1915356 RepID=A0ABR2GT61_9EUKA